MKEMLKENQSGFSGFTHWLIAIFLFFCMWLIPWSFSQSYIASISKSAVFGICIFLAIGGASLLPDLDSSPIQEGGSTAVSQLGLLGVSLSILFVTISGIVYSVFHTKSDDKPKSQHRMLFHSFLIPILIYFLNIKTVPNTNDTLWNNMNQDHMGAFAILIISVISIYLGSNMLLYRPLRLIGKQRIVQHLCLIIMVFFTYYMLNMPFKDLRLVGIAISLGYLFHILGDLFTKGSSPIFFPIPIPSGGKKYKLWKKPYFIGYNLAITTGGSMNVILDFVLIGANIYLFWNIFIQG